MRQGCNTGTCTHAHREQEEEAERLRQADIKRQEEELAAAKEERKAKREEAVRGDAKQDKEQVLVLIHGPEAVVACTKRAVYFVVRHEWSLVIDPWSLVCVHMYSHWKYVCVCVCVCIYIYIYIYIYISSA